MKTDKERKEEKLQDLENRIYQAAYKAYSNLQIDLTNLSQGKAPPKKIKALSLEDALSLLRFYEDCHIAADQSNRKKLKFLSVPDLSDEAKMAMNEKLFLALEAYCWYS